MEDTETLEEDDIDSQNSNIPINHGHLARNCSIKIIIIIITINIIIIGRAVIRPVFPGHVLFFRVKNSVRPDFLNLAKCPVFL